jgi:hypothetical protein
MLSWLTTELIGASKSGWQDAPNFWPSTAACIPLNYPRSGLAIGRIFRSYLLCMECGGPVLWFVSRAERDPQRNRPNLPRSPSFCFGSSKFRLQRAGGVVLHNDSIARPFAESNSLLFTLSSLGLMNVETDGSRTFKVLTSWCEDGSADPSSTLQHMRLE